MIILVDGTIHSDKLIVLVDGELRGRSPWVRPA